MILKFGSGFACIESALVVISANLTKMLGCTIRREITQITHLFAKSMCMFKAFFIELGDPADPAIVAGQSMNQ